MDHPRQKENLAIKLLSGFILCISILVFCVKPYHMSQAFMYMYTFNVESLLLNGTIWFLLMGFISLIYVRYYNFTILEILFLSLVLYSLLSGFWSVNLASNFAANGILATTFLLYLFFKHFLTEYKEKSITMISLGVACFCVILSFHYLLFNGEEILAIRNKNSYQSEIRHLQSFVGGKNHTGILMVLTIPFILFNLYYRKNIYISGLAAALCLITILVTGSRNAYLGLFLFGLSLMVQYRFKKKQWILILGSMASILVLFISIVGIDLFAKQLFRDSLSSRMAIWSNLLQLYEESNLLLGIGAGQWFHLKDTLAFTQNLHPHNDILSYLVELGVIGFGLFISLLIMMLYRALKIKKSDNITSWYWIAILLFASFLSSVILFNFDEIKFKLNHAALLVLIWAFISFRYESTYGAQKSKYQLVGRGFTTVLSIFLFMYGVLLFQQSFVVSDIIQYREEENMKEMLQSRNEVFDLVVNQIRQEPVGSYINPGYEEYKLWGERLEEIEEMGKSFPTHINNNARLAFYYANKKEYDKALDYMNRIFIKKRCAEATLKLVERFPESYSENSIFMKIKNGTKNCSGNKGLKMNKPNFINRTLENKNQN